MSGPLGAGLKRVKATFPNIKHLWQNGKVGFLGCLGGVLGDLGGSWRGLGRFGAVVETAFFFYNK